MPHAPAAPFTGERGRSLPIRSTTGLFSALRPADLEVKTALATILFVVAGAVLLLPLTARLPLLGWDWFYFVYGHNPTLNMQSAASAYPPFFVPLMRQFTWMPWRQSLALLSGVSILTVALATWRQNKTYMPIVFALVNPILYWLLWAGLPDGLALLGLVSGVLPLALVKPQVAVWGLFEDRKLLVRAGLFFLVTLIIWPGWPLAFRNALFFHSSAFGWAKTGWPVALLGLLLLLGAGKNPYRLMAAGSLLSPFLMPYHLVLILPIMGQVAGWRLIVIWATSWLSLLATGLHGPFIYLNLVFPVTAYCLTHSWSDYQVNLLALWRAVRRFVRAFTR